MEDTIKARLTAYLRYIAYIRHTYSLSEQLKNRTENISEYDILLISVRWSAIGMLLLNFIVFGTKIHW